MLQSVTIELRNVSVDSATGTPILRDINLRIDSGEAVAFIGRSGAGKTTSLRLINGLAQATRGEVLIDDIPLASTDLIALRRRIGYVIQGSGLFPHRTVYENVATIPRLLAWPDAKTRDAAKELLATLGLPFEQFADRYPRSLSGGEQQRVGIARAMIANPHILLCDEPFGALDPIVRRELQETFVRLREGRSVTIVFVTHDLGEALRVAERIILFDGGRVVSDSAAREFAHQPLPLVQQLVASASLPESA